MEKTKKILGTDVPTLTIKESRKVANILRNSDKENSLSLAVKMGASSKLHSTVDTLKEDLSTVDSDIKKSIKEEVVYTTLFDYGIEDKETVVYSTGDGEIAFVKKGASSFEFRNRAFHYHCCRIFNNLRSACKEGSLENIVKNLELLEIALSYGKVKFNIDKDALLKAYKDGSLPDCLKFYIKPKAEAVPMIDILYTEKEGEE